jgi:hypothetical protein
MAWRPPAAVVEDAALRRPDEGEAVGSFVGDELVILDRLEVAGDEGFSCHFLSPATISVKLFILKRTFYN